HFRRWQFRFNYLYANCTGTGTPTNATSPTLTGGAKFVARGNWPSMPSPANAGVQDFLLLELNDALTPIKTEGYMAGWNRKSNFTQAERDDEYYRFIGFHHPGGDYMKQCVSENIDHTGTFNQ